MLVDFEADTDTCFAVDSGKDSVADTDLASIHFAVCPGAFHPAADSAVLAHLAPAVGIAAAFAIVASAPDPGAFDSVAALDFAAGSAASVAVNALDPSHRQEAFATDSPVAVQYMQAAALHYEVPRVLVSALLPCPLYPLATPSAQQLSRPYPQALPFSPQAQAIPLPRGRSS